MLNQGAWGCSVYGTVLAMLTMLLISDTVTEKHCIVYYSFLTYRDYSD